MFMSTPVAALMGVLSCVLLFGDRDNGGGGGQIRGHFRA